MNRIPAALSETRQLSKEIGKMNQEVLAEPVGE
jgi:hypothetical protein